MHSSFFNYNIQKPYPFRWFTPVVLTGGLALAVLLSVLNFVQNSYVLVVEYVDNPNTTISQGVWYKNWPSYLTNGVQPTCQPTNLPVNTQFFTNQSGLMWTVTSYFANKANPVALPSLPYLNNVLEDCDVSELRVGYDGTNGGSNDVDVSILQYSAWSVEVRAFVTCSVSTSSGNTFINATAVYDALTPYEMTGVNDFISKNATSRASMFWSAILLRAYWIQAVNKIWTVNDDGFQDRGTSLSKGVVTLYPNKNESAIANFGFFDLQYDFLQHGAAFGFTGPLNSAAFYINNQNNKTSYPDIWESVDQLAQAAFSAVLADLGQTQLPVQSSLVRDAGTIQRKTSSFNDSSHWNLPGGIPNMLVHESYDSRQASSSATGNLGLSPSVVATKYLCQIPQRKPFGDIFVSVLLADLVFLQSAWKLYTLLVDKLLLQRHLDAMCCAGYDTRLKGSR